MSRLWERGGVVWGVDVGLVFHRTCLLLRVPGGGKQSKAGRAEAWSPLSRVPVGGFLQVLEDKLGNPYLEFKKLELF